MVASEFAFLVLGLALGIPTGAALLLVIRSRPLGSREVRLTVTPDSVPRRRSATLATDPFQTTAEPAAGGPAETTTRRGGRPQSPAQGDAGRPAGAPTATAGRTNVLGRPGESRPDHGPSPAADAGRDTRPEPPDAAARGTPPNGAAARVGISIGAGADPVLAAIQREPIARPYTLDERPAPPEPALSGIALLEKAVEAREAQRAAARGGATAVSEAPPDGQVSGSVGAVGGDAQASTSAAPSTPDVPPLRQGDLPPRQGSPPPGGNGVGPVLLASGETNSGDAGPGDAPGSEPGTPPPVASSTVTPTYTGPCADQRRATDEVCGLAERMAGQATVAAESLRAAQRQYDAHLASADRAAAIADPRAQRAAKEAAQHAFRQGRADAGSREQVEGAARTWLQEINRINTASRDAAQAVTRERQAANAMAMTVERLTLEADAARVQAEAAREGCINAREALAECEEAAFQREPRPAVAPAAAPAGADAEPAAPQLRLGHARPPEPSLAGAAAGAEQDAADAQPEESGALAAAARGDGQPAILQLLTGDRAALERLSADVAGADTMDQRHWQLQLGEFVDAIVARAIEACAFDFPTEHPFWGPFTVDQNRDIALALSSLGFRFDGLGGFVDDRVPAQRDLSLAVGYAGLDPMRIRRWPTDAEMQELFRDVRVAADEYLSDAAGGLTLGELVTLLGRRADALTDLWNAWGRVRPRLLEPI